MNEDLKNIIVSDLILLDKPSSFLDNKRPWDLIHNIGDLLFGLFNVSFIP